MTSPNDNNDLFIAMDSLTKYNKFITFYASPFVPLFDSRSLPARSIKCSLLFVKISVRRFLLSIYIV
jgi:hypothetical protein